MELKRCSRCKDFKDVSEFPPSHCYCRPCLAEYNRERIEKRKSIKEVLRNVQPLGEDRSRGRPRKVAKGISVAIPGKPKKAAGKGSKYVDLIKPPVITEQPETVEQFLSRGGSIVSVRMGESGYKG